jgi:aryl-alcohol dehydrogenase-like predicted oxidoreductase
MSAFYGKPTSNQERFDFLDAVYEAGERFIDTADVYG